jgi:hypothetical protein
MRNRLLALAILSALTVGFILQAIAQVPEATHKVGVIKAVSADTIVLRSDDGSDFTVTVPDSARLLRINPGQRDLKDGEAILRADLQPGDRMLVNGVTGHDAHSLTASLIVIVRQADLSKARTQQEAEWQKHGIGGIVQSLDSSTGTIKIALSPAYSTLIKTGEKTGFLRYAPDSAKFSNAKPGSFDQIKIGDQLRAHGEQRQGAPEFVADQIISGSFRNIAGTVVSIDTEAQILSVKDLLTKKTVLVKVKTDCQLRSLPASAARKMTSLLKTKLPESGSAPGTEVEHLLGETQIVKFDQLHKDDALMIISGSGDGEKTATALAVLAGVEPILAAAPDGRNIASLFSGWNLSTTASDGASQ